VVVLGGGLLDLMQRRHEARQYEAQSGPALADHVFHRQGRPIVDFRDDWTAACEKAGTPGLLFHDLRRSAVRQLEKSGVSQAVAMKITGHKTDSVFRRYRIVDEGDIAQALEAVQTANADAPASNVVSIRKARA